MSTETMNIALTIGLATLLTVMAVTLAAGAWRGRWVSRPGVAAGPSESLSPNDGPVEGQRSAAPPAQPQDPGPRSGPFGLEPGDDGFGSIAGATPAAGPAAGVLPSEEDVMQILVDPATGLDNRWAWDRLAHQEDLRRRRYSRPTSVVVAELPGIEKLAQRVGREPADRLIIAIGEALRRYSRASDRIARVDYARFYVLLPETDETGAANLVARIREACDLWLEAGAVALHLRMGWATLGPDEPIEAAVATAWERLGAVRPTSESALL